MGEVKLSDRVRPNSEAAPWVCDEIVRLEARSEALEKERDALRAEVAKLKAENSTLRTLVAVQQSPCIYCGLTEMAKCASGFPGCARADDLICGEDEAFKAVVGERNNLRAEVKQAYEDGRISACNAGKPGCPRVKELEAEVAKLRAACAAKDAALRKAHDYSWLSTVAPEPTIFEIALSDTAGRNYIDATGAVEATAKCAEWGADVEVYATVPDDWAGKPVLIVVKP